ncbi:DNA-directed RNA polymerase subunit RPC12/RpoP [Paraburkholderia sp. CI2]|uniref:ogr/Delta-like zinc finger family protein n=1 Tax=Paraburkholderia sp. CI2 TaxID=2723093 RepID=UPI0017F2291A|nr:ogr/Delta-like zinc finger family protein [Paraburkholderia sp. CI2]MBB5469189.1 DNA-directed RNA polymerase subunit RPC12/RpoP [Paraburkholderia sp. CI2]
MNDMSIKCPACDDALEARHSERMSDTLRRLYFWCPSCGFRAPATLEVLHSLSPPAPRYMRDDLALLPARPLGGSINARTAKQARG